MNLILKKEKNKKIAFFICFIFIFQIFLPTRNKISFAGTNPSDIEIREKLQFYAKKYNIPSIILASIAFQESGWKQFDSSGETIIGYNSDTFDIGIMQINSFGRSSSDIERLKADIDYNIETGAKILSNKWDITPGIGNMDKSIIENWYYAIWAYNGFAWTNNPNCEGGRHYQDKIISLMGQKKFASDGSLLWEPVSLTSLDFSKIDENPHWIDTILPLHYSELYNNYNKGDNFILISSPQEMVITNFSSNTKFSFQNIGSTQWNEKYYISMFFDSKEEIKANVIPPPVVSGGIFNIFVKFPILSNGAHQVIVSMYNDNGEKFGSENRIFFYYQNNYLLDNPFTSATEDVSIGQKVSYDFTVNKPNFGNSFNFYFSLINNEGKNVLDSAYLFSKNIFNSFSVVDEGNKLKVNLSLLLASDFNEEILSEGKYILNIFVSSSVKSVLGQNKDDSSFCVFSKNFNLINHLSSDKINIVLLSNYSGDKVLIDSQDYLISTPALLSLDLGLHVITILHNGLNYNYDIGSLEPKFNVVYSLFSFSDKNINSLETTEKEIVFSIDNPNSVYSRLFSISNFGFSIGSREGVVYPDYDWLVVSPITFSNGNCNFVLSIDTKKIFNIFGTFNNSLTNNLHFCREGVNYTIPVKVNFKINDIPIVPIVDSVNGKLTSNLNTNKISVNFSLNKSVDTFENIKLSLSFFGEKDISILPANTSKFISLGNNKFDLIFKNIRLNSNFYSLLKDEIFTVLSPTNINQIINIKLSISGISSAPFLEYSNSIKFLDLSPGPPTELKLSRTTRGVYLSWIASDINNFNNKTVLVLNNSNNKNMVLATILFSGKSQNYSHIFIPTENDTYYYSIRGINDFGKSVEVDFKPINILAKKYIEFYLEKPYFLLNGKKNLLNKTIILYKNLYYLEKSDIYRAFGLKTIYDSKNNFLTISDSHNNVLKIKLNSSIIYFNNVKNSLVFNNFQKNGTYYINLKYICEKFNFSFEIKGTTVLIKEK